MEQGGAMSEKLYARWPKYQGQLLMVVTSNVRVEGVLIGPEPIGATAGAPEPPWALLTDNGLLFINPDDSTVTIYARDGLIDGTDDGLHPGLGRSEREAFLAHCEAMLFAARELANSTIRIDAQRTWRCKRQIKKRIVHG
jgi:hypothetical protein